MTATIHHLIPRQQRLDAERYRRAVEAIEREEMTKREGAK